MTRSPDSPGVVVFPPVLFGATLVAGLILHWLRPVAVLPALVARLIGIMVLVASGLLVRSAEAAMRRAGTDPRPDHPSLAIVTEGPFRFTRNPMYVGTTGLYVAVSLLVNALWPLVLLLPMLAVLHWGVVRREERYLEGKFGEPYRLYRLRVRRWV
ncbi:MAG TPA: PEMT/PEM2 methyltransferase family protein [Gemmatimonadales bacterium]|nr:PEMT/PEM2 methyltransferase family protein [Gemmatimonadales bacterium]